jgi:Holliday junction resolvase
MTNCQGIPGRADVLDRIKRGLSGYVSYLAACEMNQSFSEYVLYEPILRILTARGHSVKCEVVCPGVQQPKTGDRKRLDIVATKQGIPFAMEVKWAKHRKLNAQKDYDKLTAYLDSDGGATGRAYLCVFGRKSQIRDLALTPDCFDECGRTVIAEFGKTRYSCRIFEALRRAPR